MGRSWHASKGASLTFSLGVPLRMSDWSGLSLAVGCALADALEPEVSNSINGTARLQLKWPNDLWLDGRKLGGILIETVQAGGHRMAVIGVGLNIEAAPEGVEDQCATGYASLSELQPGITAPQALARVARPLIEALLAFEQQGFAPWLNRYARRDLLAGQAVQAGTLEGIGAGVSASGELMIQTPQGPQRVTGGEVSVRLSRADPPKD